MNPIALLLSWILCTTAAMGVTAKNHGAKPRSQARVRIPVSFIPYEKVLVKNTKGESRISYQKTPAKKHRLRAKISQINHFYVGPLRVTTEPLRWTRETRQYKVRLSFFRVYGLNHDVEEKLGHLDVYGVLNGEDGVYDFSGYAEKQFLGKSGKPSLDVVIGIPQEKRPTVARRPVVNKSQ